MVKVTPHVYPLLQNVNFDLVNPTCHATWVFFELIKIKKATCVFTEFKKNKKKERKERHVSSFFFIHFFKKIHNITISFKHKPRINKPKIKLIQAKHYFTNNN
jgi:hypothetical protein